MRITSPVRADQLSFPVYPRSERLRDARLAAKQLGTGTIPFPNYLFVLLVLLGSRTCSSARSFFCDSIESLSHATDLKYASPAKRQPSTSQTQKAVCLASHQETAPFPFQKEVCAKNGLAESHFQRKDRGNFEDVFPIVCR